MHDFSESKVLNVDVGTYFAPPGPGSSAVNQLMAEAAADLPMDVMNLTPDDLETWARLGAPASPTRLISTNLQLEEKLPFPVPRHAVAEVPTGSGAVRIGFLGVVSPTRIPPRLRIEAEDPVAAVRTHSARALEESDFLVVLADVEDSALARLARAHPKIYAVVQLERHYKLPRPEQIENAVLLRTVERGRYLMRLDLEVKGGEVISYAPEYVRLDSDVEEAGEYLRRSRNIVGHLP